MNKKFAGALALALLLTAGSAVAEPLKIAYSDWPGWVAWDVADKKGFFKAEGVDVQLLWFEYGPSMDAFTAGKVDAVAVTNGDALVTASGGARNVMILLNDFSAGNDMIVAKAGINSVKDLKGKKIGVEVGLVDHLLLLKALQLNGLKESDVTIVKMSTDQAAQVLASGSVDAVAAWQPNSGQALKAVAGSKAIFTSADVPGLIYDTLAVSPASLAKNKADWAKVVKVWYKTVDYILDPKNFKEVVAIMSARDNLPPDEYAAFMKGTHLLTLAEAKKALQKGAGLDSLYGSSQIVDGFNVANGVYTTPSKIDPAIDPSFILALK
jgi:NitT/TauT family transport system substrate-binding protein